jgi:hypothetical protein
MKLSSKQFGLFVTLLVLSNMVNHYKSDSVCSLKALKIELLEDLADNGMLDCMRVIEKPHFKEETEQEKNLRVLAQWDTSCSFEATNSWMEALRTSIGVQELVDVNGEPVKKDFEDQADMCEIVRAAVAKNIFSIKSLDMRKIPSTVVDLIACAGPAGDKDGPQICAASSGSYFNKGSWTIFLDSSNIKFSGKPIFTKKPVQEQSYESKEELETPPVVKDLLKYNKDELKKKGGFFAKLINKAKSASSAIKDYLEGDQSEKIKTFVSSGTTQINATDKFTPTTLKGNSIPVEYLATKLSFLMASYKASKTEVLRLRFMLNGIEISESRQLCGPKTASSISSAFIMNLDPNGVQNGVSVEYKSNKNLTIQTNGVNTNFSLVSILFHAANIYKYVNYADVELTKTPTLTNFQKLGDASLAVRNDKDYDAYYLVFYNVAAIVKDTDTGEMFGTILYKPSSDKGPTEIMDTAQITGKGIFLSTHSAAVVKVKQGESMNFTLGYVYSGSTNLTIANHSENNTVVGLSALELPQSAVVHRYEPKSIVLLNSKIWKSLNMDAQLTFKNPTKLLILYNFCIKTAGASFTIRLKVNNKHSIRSVMNYQDSEYACGQGYVLEKLAKGKYKFDLEFTSDAKGTLLSKNPEDTVRITRQMVSMTIIEIDN